MSKNDGGATSHWCAWCFEERAVRKQGRLWLCAMHYRFQQMRVNAKRQNKIYPSYANLETMLEINGMTCQVCKREMNWLGVEGHDTVLTLQHDRSGIMRFLCRSCNTRHAGMGDNLYKLKPNEKWCPRCEEVKLLDDFYKDRTGGKYGGRKTYCKKCSYEYVKEWKSRKLVA